VEEVEGRGGLVVEGDGVVGSLNDRHLDDQSVTPGVYAHLSLPWFVYDQTWSTQFLREEWRPYIPRRPSRGWGTLTACSTADIAECS
jgi:hypothetical protein